MYMCVYDIYVCGEEIFCVNEEVSFILDKYE